MDQVHVYLTPALREKVREAAQREELTMAAWIRIAIRNRLRLIDEEKQGKGHEAKQAN